MRANERGHDMGHPWLLTRVLTVEGHNGFSGATQVSAYYYRMARHHLFKSQTHRERSKVRYSV